MSTGFVSRSRTDLTLCATTRHRQPVPLVLLPKTTEDSQDLVARTVLPTETPKVFQTQGSLCRGRRRGQGHLYMSSAMAFGGSHKTNDAGDARWNEKTYAIDLVAVFGGLQVDGIVLLLLAADPKRRTVASSSPSTERVWPCLALVG